jgi:superfamily II DNA or RNA helicase
LNTDKNDIHNILLIVPNIQLVDQFVKDLKSYGLDNLLEITFESGEVSYLNKDDEITIDDKNIKVSELTIENKIDGKQIKSIDEAWNIVNFSSDQDKKNKKKKIDFVFKKKNITISNIQWLMLHGDKLPYTDCIIQDEVHAAKKASELSKLIKSVKIPYKFGCTGTLPKNIEDCWNISRNFWACIR